MNYKILVLDDMAVRIDHLHKIVEGQGVEVVWVQTVSDFRKKLEELDRNDIRLILLDHDLGRYSLSSGDSNGETGLDAVKAIPDQSPIPVIVWSVNPYPADCMVHDLTKKGIVCRRIPFSTDSWILRKTIQSYC